MEMLILLALPLCGAVLLALASLLAACDMATPAGRAPEPPAASSAMEFRGERPCTDCLGIESWLRLDQDGVVQDPEQ